MNDNGYSTDEIPLSITPDFIPYMFGPAFGLDLSTGFLIDDYGNVSYSSVSYTHLKPAYKVNMKFDNLPEEAAASVTFSNINEDGYTYTFTDLSDIKLRDGQYDVTVNNIGNVPYRQKITSNLKVDGKAVDKTVSFIKNTNWDFSKLNGNPGIEAIGENNYYSGLALTGSVMENKIYLLALTDGEINFPVKKGQIVNIGYCYCAARCV